MNKIYQKTFSGVKNAGFTLIELLVVVLIIAILSAVSLPQYQMAVYKTRFNKIRPLVDALARAQEVYYMANGHYAADARDLDISFPSDCQYEERSSAADDVINCRDVSINIGKSAGRGLAALVKNCPAYEGGCAVYNVPYRVASDVGNRIYGSRPSCSPAVSVTDRAREYGQKVCLSLGGKEKTVIVGTVYYL